MSQDEFQSCTDLKRDLLPGIKKSWKSPDHCCPAHQTTLPPPRHLCEDGDGGHLGLPWSLLTNLLQLVTQA